MLLAIESSCDDSAIAVIETEGNGALRFHKRLSQAKDHARFGGVVPELAARLHAKALPQLLEEVTEYLPLLKAVAVTNEPGLTVTLSEGVMMAKALSVALDIPIVPVHHLRGHIYSLFVEQEAAFPMTVLITSGGHTEVVEVQGYRQMRVLAGSMDDSLGEAYDKVAKMMGLGYPGGPVIEALAKEGDPKRFDFTVPLIKSHTPGFSYSGLKNSVRLALEALGDIKEQDRRDIAAGFQRVAVRHITMQLERLFRTKVPARLGVVGGVSANMYFREAVGRVCETFGIELFTAPLAFCSDNAAMIARAGLEGLRLGEAVDSSEITIRSRVSLEAV